MVWRNVLSVQSAQDHLAETVPFFQKTDAFRGPIRLASIIRRVCNEFDSNVDIILYS